MIRSLVTLLGPAHAARLYRYLAWLVTSAVLQGLAVALLVPILQALFIGDLSTAMSWLAGLAVMAALTCIAHYQQAMKGFALALVVLTTLHNRLGQHLVSLPLGWFNSEKVGRLSRSATSGTLMVTGLFAHYLGPVVAGVVVPATVALTLFVFDWRLGLTAVLCAPLIYFTHHWSASAIGKNDERVEAAATLAGNRVVEFARYQQVLRAFGQTRNGYEPLQAANRMQKQAGGSMLSQTFPKLLAGGLSVQMAFALLVGVGIALAVEGEIDAIELVALLALAARFVGPLAEAAARSGLLRMAGNDLQQLVSILREPPLPEPSVSQPLSAPGSLAFEQVSFAYPGGPPVLRNLSFHAPARSMIAIVGASGSGKTTITRLLMRFFDVTHGSVKVGGVDVRELSNEALMAQLALVMQDVYLFDDSLEANIRVGSPDASPRQVAQAARLAGVDEIVARLPQGWNTPVGEGGAALSGGERQRVSLARALLKRAPIVLLDEATAALDPQNEAYVQAALGTLMQSSTVLVIAHRLPTIMAADQILVLDEGCLVESGTHHQLLALQGRYAGFWHDRQRAGGWRLKPQAQPC
ncbi:ABC transporter ATP-binding protein [Pseudomonas fluorescens]|uniref:ABC transporter ATP-binding protein n=1 Tax=Pseudomonas fluorescens TaxID=294 RepID=A0A944HHT5_PSEFL|nr:ABC transporter ATP-binding protein [Pseudomonas fluorescens]MBT2305698.1 ABC transporter ATP-binding protein [Pseudomonas fluorescens]MBT2314279.1 ABC transporter ATP-binding protein [Pseudomonas fluorescens]MBT2319229.1 ABC transporter ATP-binding protein [Pseudomonas fluorescens]MBT2328498.1 ABC transporter ATP-binding protein [Pseudomonas fluorescens]